MPFSLFLALKYLRPQRSFVSVVTLISVVGVLLGVAILVIVLSVMTGFDTMWREKILSFKPHLTVISRYGAVEDEEALCERIAAVKGVTGVAAALETRALVQANGRMSSPIVVGVTPERASGVSKIPTKIVAGAFDLEGDHAVIGIDMAAQLRVGVGDKLLVYSAASIGTKDELSLPEEVTVAGIFNLGMWDYDSGFVLTSLDMARDMVGLDSGAAAIYVMTDDPFLFETYGERLQEAIGPEYAVRSWKEIDSLMFNALSTEKTMMFILLVFITIVAIFCVTNTLIVITVQKTNEIGLLKALGFPSRKIMAAFVWHGWIQCMVGIVAGVCAGLLVLHNLKRIVTWLSSISVEVFPKEIYRLNEIPWSTSFEELARIALFVMVFCTIASIIPAWRAARLDPVEALRNE